jgi:hypothetical protein
MKCFTHHDHEAIGICKACHKAVCSSCAKDTGKGLACSDNCIKEVEEQNQIIDKSKHIYGIGKKPALMPTGLIMHFLFGILFAGFGIYQSVERGVPEWFLLLMGAGFIVVGCIGWYKNRKLNLNC